MTEQHTFASNVHDVAFVRRHAKTLPGSGARYIPWALLYAEARMRHPDIQFSAPTLLTAWQGTTGILVQVTCAVPSMTPPASAEVELAVTDSRNRTLQSPDAAAVQNTISRAMAKAISLATGLGLSLWFGDSQMPTGERAEPVSDDEVERMTTGMMAAESVSTLNEFAAGIRSYGDRLTDEQRDTLAAVYREKSAELREGGDHGSAS